MGKSKGSNRAGRVGAISSGFCIPKYLAPFAHRQNDHCCWEDGCAKGDVKPFPKTNFNNTKEKQSNAQSNRMYSNLYGKHAQAGAPLSDSLPPKQKQLKSEMGIHLVICLLIVGFSVFLFIAGCASLCHPILLSGF